MLYIIALLKQLLINNKYVLVFCDLEEEGGGGGGGQEEQEEEDQQQRKKKKKKNVVVYWLLNVPATCWCISGTDVLRQSYMLPHWDRSCRSNLLSHRVTVY